ncbi:DUF4880 domain-containing protein [Azoarcus indigens]|uniref:FecR family protein n=1 Tax=Azoarcus indigens TaxID=29545 RepID=A0A4R6DR79_9RHOO|nr:FecR domain-containing protein [Azoarcus indigens]NMG68126.1 DUF4880 domain-containing protein [Azoarcus indigens]TDN47526.1 FecR family protein [Azoarcus indigens]
MSMAKRGADDPVAVEASRWLVRRGRGALSAAEENAFDSWYAAHPDHAATYRKLERLWQQLGQVDRNRLAPRRRKSAVLALLLAGSLLAGGLGPAAVLHLRADHIAATGEILTLTLADGSTAILDSDSAITYREDGGRREVRLLRGRALFQVRSSAGGLPPFVVLTNTASATALGTRFEVERTEDATRVAVYESRVEVRCLPCDPPASRVLRTGESATVADAGALAAAQASAAGESWTHGMLGFDDVSVAEAAERLGRYTHKPVLVLGDVARQRRLSAVVDARDPDAAAAALAAGSGLRASLLPGLILLRE